MITSTEQVLELLELYQKIQSKKWNDSTEKIECTRNSCNALVHIENRLTYTLSSFKHNVYSPQSGIIRWRKEE